MRAFYVSVHNRKAAASAPVPAATKASNQHRIARNEYPAHGTSRLSGDQKAKICIQARAAFEHVFSRTPTDAAELQAWRQAEQERATGKPSLTVCTQGDYLPLIAHFADLAGETGIAMNAEMRAGTSEHRVAMTKLKEACDAKGLALSYPAAICRNQNKCTLDQATPKQIWRLVFTVKNRKAKPGEANRRSAQKNADGPNSEISADPRSSAVPPVPPGFKKVGGMLFQITGAKPVAADNNEPF